MEKQRERCKAPVRKGTASLIKAFNPIVVPVKIDGFNKAFDKKGLKFKERGVQLSVIFGKPMKFRNEATCEEIHAFVKKSILVTSK